MRHWTMLALGIVLTAASHASAQDCTASNRLCQLPAYAELVAKERAVQAATPRPATWAARAAALRTWLTAAADDEGKPLDSAALSGHIIDQIHNLDMELERTKGISPSPTPFAIMGDKCLATWLSMDCYVPMNGTLRDPDGTNVLWQLQSGASEEDGGGMGAMLWDAKNAGEPRLIGWTFEGVWMETPRYSPEHQLLWVSGRMVGTGDGNADILFQRQQGKWVEIDLESWQADLARRLPKGFGAWHGAEYDLTSLSAQTELWKQNDSNCCPTGGRANLDFEIRGATLTLKGVSAQIGGLESEWKDY